MPQYNDYRYMPVRSAAILTTSYVAGDIIGVNTPEYMAGPVGLYNQLTLYVNFTIGSLTTAELIIEFSDDLVNWVQETIDDIAASTGIITQRNSVRTFTASGAYRIPLPINDQFIRVSIKGTGTVTASSATINAIIGNN